MGGGEDLRFGPAAGCTELVPPPSLRLGPPADGPTSSVFCFLSSRLTEPLRCGNRRRSDHRRVCLPVWSSPDREQKSLDDVYRCLIWSNGSIRCIQTHARLQPYIRGTTRLLLAYQVLESSRAGAVRSHSRLGPSRSQSHPRPGQRPSKLLVHGRRMVSIVLLRESSVKVSVRVQDRHLAMESQSAPRFPRGVDT